MFKCLFQNDVKKGKNGGGKKAKELLKKLTSLGRPEEVNQELIIEKVDQMMFKPKQTIAKFFDEYYDAKRQVWTDADPKQMQLLSGVVTADNLILFTAVNGYKVSKNKQGKFG